MVLRLLAILCFVSLYGFAPGDDWRTRNYYKFRHPEVLLNPEKTGQTRIVNRPNGTNTIAVVKNDTASSIYHTAFLIGKSGNWFKVALFCDADSELVGIGWIKNKELVVYSRNYRDFPLVLYSSPDDKSRKLKTVYDPYNDLMDVESFSGLWLKVRIKIDGEEWIGWIPFEMQCANAVSTCS